MELSADERILLITIENAMKKCDWVLFEAIQKNLATNYNLEVFPTGTGGTMIRRSNG
jgi:RIO-like serine/threonine protein kinase